jgi:hypothetical protein
LIELLHPNVYAPWSQWSEEETLHLVVPYSNPFRWQSRRRNVNDCIRHLRSCPNVRPYLVELAYGDRPFEVTEAGDPDVIQLRTDCALFHKENLINLGVSHFPPGAKYGGYSDGDFHFSRYDFALEAIHMLQHYHFVQLFSNYADLTPSTATSDTGHRAYRYNSSFGWNYLHQAEFKALKLKKQATDPYYGHAIPTKAFPFGWNMPSFSMVGGLLDTCVMGSADWWMAFGLIGQVTMLQGDATIRNYNDDIRNWQQRANQLQYHPGKAPVGCVDNFATHFYHGASSNRAYGTREAILRDFTFNPRYDITRDWQGVYRWTGNKPSLRDAVSKIFISRREDDSPAE